jgi:lipoprotein-releasing system permease protein
MKIGKVYHCVNTNPHPYNCSFNIVGSLSMLIIDKRTDVETLKSLGASNALIQKIFLAEGMLMFHWWKFNWNYTRAANLWLQITFKLIKLEGREIFIIDAYPVEVRQVIWPLYFLW